MGRLIGSISCSPLRLVTSLRVGDKVMPYRVSPTQGDWVNEMSDTIGRVLIVTDGYLCYTRGMRFRLADSDGSAHRGWWYNLDCLRMVEKNDG